MRHIIVNGLSISHRSGGIKTYLFEMLSALLKADPTSSYEVLHRASERELFAPVTDPFPNAHLKSVRMPNWGGSPTRVIFDQFVVPWLIRHYQEALLFTPSNIATLTVRIPQVVVIQAPLALKSIRAMTEFSNETVSLFYRAYNDFLMPVSLRHATRVVVYSQFLGDQILANYPETNAKLRIILNGANDSKFSQSASKVGLPKIPYFLFVSTLFPYKNAARLLQAFAWFMKNNKTNPGIRLKLAGKDPDGRQLSLLKTLSDELGISQEIDWLGLVPYEHVPHLYRDALAFIYPSEAETFGFPVLEAMSAGTPVIASNRMSVPEVVGDAGLIVDPIDNKALGQAMLRLASDETLRRTLAEKGRKRVADFSWARAAEQMLVVFAECLVSRNATPSRRL